MPITPNEDKTCFFERIRGDPWLCGEIGIKTEEDAVTYILKRREIDDDLNAKIRRIAIFDIPSDEATGPFERGGIQVDMLAAAANQSKVDGCIEQITALCGPGNEDGWCIQFQHGGETVRKVIERVVKVGDLASAPGYYRAGVRFYYYSATPTKKRTI